MICDRAGILADGELKNIITMDDAVSSNDTIWEISCQGGALNLSGLSGIEDQNDIKQVIRGNRHIVSTGDKDKADRIMEEIKNQGSGACLLFNGTQKHRRYLYKKCGAGHPSCKPSTG